MKENLFVSSLNCESCLSLIKKTLRQFQATFEMAWWPCALGVTLENLKLRELTQVVLYSRV